MEKRKVILGLKEPSEFTLEERKLIVEEYLRTGCRKIDIWEKYTGRPKENGALLSWMRQLGHDIPAKWGKLAGQNSVKMPKSKANIKRYHRIGIPSNSV